MLAVGCLTQKDNSDTPHGPLGSRLASASGGEILLTNARLLTMGSDGVIENAATGNDLGDVDNVFVRLNADRDFSAAVSGNLLLEYYTSSANFGLLPFDPDDRGAALDDATVMQNPPPAPCDVDVDTFRMAARVEWELGNGLLLTSLTSYLDSDLVVQPVDGDNTEEIDPTIPRAAIIDGSLDGYRGAGVISQSPGDGNIITNVLGVSVTTVVAP